MASASSPHTPPIPLHRQTLPGLCNSSGKYIDNEGGIPWPWYNVIINRPCTDIANVM